MQYLGKQYSHSDHIDVNVAAAVTQNNPKQYL